MENNVGLMMALAGAMIKAPTDTQVGDAVDAWLTAHPEATTTVEDGAITEAKLNSTIKGILASAVKDGKDLSDLLTYLGATVYRKDKIDADTTYTAYISSAGVVKKTTNANAYLYGFEVEANKTYVIYGLSVRVVASSVLAVFSESAFDGTNDLSGNTVLIPKDTATTATDYNVVFTPTADGYVYCYGYGSYGKLGLYNAEYRSLKIDDVSVATKPSESYDVSFADLFDKYESGFIDDFTTRESFVDTDHAYTVIGNDTDAPTIATGTGATRTGASGMATVAYSRSFDSFPYVCLIGRVADASQLVKVFDDSTTISAGAVSISANGGVSYNSVTYGYIHTNAAYVVLVVNSDSVTVYDDSGIEVRAPVSYTSDKPMNIALGFGANAGRLFGYGSFVEFVKRPMQMLDFNKCVAMNEDADSFAAAKSVVRFTHAIWDNNAASATVYYKPSANPYMETVQGPSNNPCIKCIADYDDDAGYRTEIGITPIKGSLKGKLGGLQRFRTSADYFMASEDNLGMDEYYVYIFQLHDSNFSVAGWTDGPPFTLRVKDGKLSAHVCYIDDGNVPQGDNVHTVDAYELCDWTMDAWHHIEVEARIGWRNVLAPRLIVRVDGVERLNIATPIGYNIVSSGGYVNTHYGLYTPQWHDTEYDHMHREVLVTNIRWEGTQYVN